MPQQVLDNDVLLQVAASKKGVIEMKKAMVIGFGLVIALSSLAYTGNNPGAKVAVHVQAHSATLEPEDLPVVTACADIQATYPGFSFDAFPVFFDLVEYLGFEYGMCWPAWTYSAVFTGCDDLTIGEIERPGDGVSQTWNECMPGPAALPGWIWLYADGPGLITVCPHPTSGKVKVLDCTMGVDPPISFYSAGVFGEPGDDPCLPAITEATSWGAIKSMFR
jgi:hypothetical protein